MLFINLNRVLAIFRTKTSLFFIIVASGFGLFNLSVATDLPTPDSLVGGEFATSTPEIPSLLRDVTTLKYTRSVGKDNSREIFDYKNPTIPFSTNSSDGRIGFKGGFYLLKPESLDKHMMTVDQGVVLLDYENPLKLDLKKLNFSPNRDLAKNKLGFFEYHGGAICDGTIQFKNGLQQRQNPYTLSADRKDAAGEIICEAGKDCYDLTAWNVFIVCPDGLDANGQLKKCNNPVTDGLKHWVELWQTNVTIQVNNPKTKDAKIERIYYDLNTQRGLKLPNWNIYIENVFTSDGRLMVARSGHANLQTRLDSISKKSATVLESEYEIIYGVAPEYAPPCDIAGFVRPGPINTTTTWANEAEWRNATNFINWPKQTLADENKIANNFKPMAFAPDDAEMVNTNGIGKRYGIAKYQFRDSEGQLIPFDRDIQGTYPWMDSKGSVVMFETVHANLFSRTYKSANVNSRFPHKPISEAFEDYTPNWDTLAKDPVTGRLKEEYKNMYYFQDSGPLKGISMAGSWTKGKIVLLDGMINNTDYGMRTRQNYRKKIQLYAENTGLKNNDSSGWVEVGDGRESTNETAFEWMIDPDGRGGGSINTNFIESLANKLNYHDRVKPLTLRDLVWTMNTGRTSEEQAFDDYISENVLINSDMTASTSFNFDRKILRDDFMIYNDGYQCYQKLVCDAAAGGRPIHIQNSSSSLKYNTPKFGAVIAGGSGRMEPVALGGIFGKGFWLEENTSLVYPIPKQKSSDLMTNTPWFLGMFVDARFNNDNEERRLFSFWKHGQIVSSFSLQGRNKIILRNVDAKVIAVLPIPKFENGQSYLKEKGWTHIGFYVEPFSNDLSVYVNGYKAAKWANPLNTQLFYLNEATLLVGGWRKNPAAGLYSDIKGVKGWIDELKVISGKLNSEELCNYARGTMVGLSNQLGVHLDGSGTDWVKRASQFPALEDTEIKAWFSNYNLNSEAIVKSTKFACYTRYDLKRLGAHRKNLPKGSVSLRELFLMPEGKVIADMPRPDFSQNNFCLSCHQASPATARELSIDALKVSTTSAQADRRRQPTHHLRTMSGIIPKDLFGIGKPAKEIKVRENSFKIIDEYLDIER